MRVSLLLEFLLLGKLDRSGQSSHYSRLDAGRFTIRVLTIGDPAQIWTSSHFSGLYAGKFTIRVLTTARSSTDLESPLTSHYSRLYMGKFTIGVLTTTGILHRSRQSSYYSHFFASKFTIRVLTTGDPPQIWTVLSLLTLLRG
jgi:hypothetical protein